MTMTKRWFSKVLVASAVAGAAAAGCAPPDPAPARGDDTIEASPALPDSLGEAERSLAQLERLLLETDSLSLTYDIRSTGAFEASLSGQLLRSGTILGLRTAGHFGEDTVNGVVLQEDGRLEVTLGDSTTALPAPPATWDALVLGMTRMGLLHNLARLTEMQPPDRMEGGVGEWVRAGDVRLEEGDAAGGRNLVFDVVVGGEVSGAATLVLGSGGLPVERRQRVDFGGATMEVLERYTWIRVPVAPGTAETFSF